MKMYYKKAEMPFPCSFHQNHFHFLPSVSSVLFFFYLSKRSCSQETIANCNSPMLPISKFLAFCAMDSPFWFGKLSPAVSLCFAHIYFFHPATRLLSPVPIFSCLFSFNPFRTDTRPVHGKYLKTGESS